MEHYIFNILVRLLQKTRKNQVNWGRIDSDNFILNTPKAKVKISRKDWDLDAEKDYIEYSITIFDGENNNQVVKSYTDNLLGYTEETVFEALFREIDRKYNNTEAVLKSLRIVLKGDDIIGLNDDGIPF
ncbi:MAG: hypothetical protein IT239_03220 [Bacteroidia bacterium]|nr:hypothetical protein [Bacteroidia bacterium]